MTSIVVQNYSVTNAYVQCEHDPNFTCLSIGSNFGNYAAFVIVDTRLVNELQHFIWTGGLRAGNRELHHFHATVTHDNRQHLQRLNLFQRERRISLHRFIASLEAGEEITKVYYKGSTEDLRISSITWLSPSLYNKLYDETNTIITDNMGRF